MPNHGHKPMSWRNISGTFLLRRQGQATRTINPGQVFDAFPEEVPLAFRDTIKPVDPAELEAMADPPLDQVDPGYLVVPRGKLPGRYNVVDGRGKLVNEQPLTAAEAAEIIKSLN